MGPELSQLTNLLELADEALRPGDPEETMTALENYSAAFAAWYEPNRTRLDEGQVTDEEEQLMLSLSERHARVVAMASELRSSTRNEMLLVQRKGRGILAYIDTLPVFAAPRGRKRGI